jgi:hypothetical protein
VYLFTEKMAAPTYDRNRKRKGPAALIEDDEDYVPRQKWQKMQTAKQTHHSFATPHPNQQEQLGEQSLFLVHNRDNLFPGSTGPKDWQAVADEFNERFKDELKKPLAWNTIQKRTGKARRMYIESNPEYAEALKYPVSMVQHWTRHELLEEPQANEYNWGASLMDGHQTQEAIVQWALQQVSQLFLLATNFKKPTSSGVFQQICQLFLQVTHLRKLSIWQILKQTSQLTLRKSPPVTQAPSILPPYPPTTSHRLTGSNSTSVNELSSP